MWLRLAHFILRNRVVVVILLGLATVLMAWKARDVKWSFEFQNTVPTDNEDYIFFEKFKNEFGDDGTTIGLAVKDSSLYELNNFLAFSKLTDTLKTLDGVEQTISISNLHQFEKNTIDKKFDFLPIRKNEINSEANLTDYLTAIRNEKMFMSQLINLKNGATFIMVYCKTDIINSKSRDLFFKKINGFGLDFEKTTQIKIHYAGLPYVRAIVAQQLKKELNFFTICSVCIAGCVLALFFRSWDSVFFPLLIVGVVIVWVMGILALLEYKITMMTGLIPPIITVIGIPNSVYLINKYHHEYSKFNNKIKSISRVIRKIGIVTLITNFTTATGFFVLNFTDIPILREFGLVAGLGILVTFIMSILILPNVFVFMSPPKYRQLKHLKFPLLNRAISFFSVISSRYRKLVYLSAIVVFFLALWGTSKLEAISYLIDDIPIESKIKKDMLFFDENFEGILPMEILIDTGKKKGVMTMKRLKKVEKLEMFLDSLPKVSTPISLISFVKSLKKAYYNNKNKYYKLPNKREKSYLSKYLGKDIENNNFVSSFVSENGQKMRITLRVADIGSKKMDNLLKIIKPKINSIFKDTGIEANITGTAPLFVKGNQFLVQNLWYSMIMAFIIISVLLFILFKKVRIVIISILPNVLPIAMTAGIMGFLGIPLKPSTTLIFSVVFGISVDDSLHYLSKYREEKKSKVHRNVISRVQRCLQETGSSMIYTSVILFAGFSIFSFSDFGGTKALGILTSTTLFIAMITNLTLLPALLIDFDKHKLKN